MKSIFTVILITLCAVMFAETATLSPIDDMYTDPDHAGVTPVANELWTANFSPAGHFERIMIRFDLTSLQDVDLVSANLNLTRFLSCPSGGTTATTFYAISQDWDESTWDHTTHIAYNESISMPYVFSGAGGESIVPFTVDITDFIEAILDSGETDYGFVIMANSGQKFSKFYSKEHGNESYRPTLDVEFEFVGVNDTTAPAPIVSAANYPNPFNPDTTIRFELASPGQVQVEVFDVRGRCVRQLLDNQMTAGEHAVHWNGRDEQGAALASGVYLYRIVTSSGVVTRRMVMMK